MNAWQYRRLQRTQRLKVIKTPLRAIKLRALKPAATKAAKPAKIKLIGKKLSLSKKKLPIIKKKESRRASKPRPKRAPPLVKIQK